MSDQTKVPNEFILRSVRFTALIDMEFCLKSMYSTYIGNWFTVYFHSSEHL